MLKPTKESFIELSKVIIPDAQPGATEETRRNARELGLASLLSDSMQASLADNGQIAPAVLLDRGDGFYEPIQGARRTANLQALAEHKVIDPTTVKRDDKGEIIEGSGKPFSTIRALVYKGITEAERLELLCDWGDIRTLDKRELFNACELLFPVKNEREIVVRLFTLLATFYPPSREIKPLTADKGADALSNFKGVIDTFKRAYKGPRVMRDAFKARLGGTQKWPSNKEMFELSKVFETEVAADSLLRWNKENPGPIFMEKWNDLLTRVEAAKVDGESRPKSGAMINRQQMEDVIKGAVSRSLKVISKIYLRDPAIPQERLGPLDQGLAALESGKITAAEFGLVLDKILTEPAPAAPVAPVAPVAPAAPEQPA